MSHHLKLERLERHVLAVGSGEGVSKVFQVQFRSDGSIYVHFPYHPNVAGIAARCDAYPGRTQFNLAESGAVTSHKVKFSHHDDGNFHFSQDGRVQTVIRGKSRALDADLGHIFSVDVQGFASFRPLPEDEYRGGEGGKHLFDFQQGRFPPAVHFSARWKVVPAGQELESLRNPIPVRHAGQIRTLIGLAPPREYPHPQHVLLVDLVPIEQLNPHADFLLLFTGGFGEELGNPAARSSFLALLYPAASVEDVRTMDLRRGGTEG